ncbi:MAG: hypothetical protein M1832_005723 [Thelocarpon impressellum]|nr:MAG: hypothetical protein M1832_005723 [Thelocarpon impressellum]
MAMLDKNRRTSHMTPASRVAVTEQRPSSSQEDRKDMWSSMLNGVASGKRLPEKEILVLGGSPDSQKNFLEGLAREATGSRKPPDRSTPRPPPVANQFALGYAYHDVLDADHEDTLARLSVYLLSDPSPSFAPLLRPLLTPQSIPNTLIVVLLDWTQPWSWLRQLREWVKVLRSLLTSLDDDCKKTMEETMIGWRDRGRGGRALDAVDSGLGAESDVSLPLGPGEWDEALGLPLCVVCQNVSLWVACLGHVRSLIHHRQADNIDVLEKERGWKEEEFDFVLQLVRTVLLKRTLPTIDSWHESHADSPADGASLIYTSPSNPNSLQTLIHSSLGIQSLLKRSSLKHNVVDRDKILIPPNWDSWGKIRILREGFDAEGVSTGWSADIESPQHVREAGQQGIEETGEVSGLDDEAADLERHAGGALAAYEDTIRDPRGDKPLDVTSTAESTTTPIEVECESTQAFLAEQLSVLEALRLEEEKGKADDDGLRDPSGRKASQGGERSGRDRDPDAGADEGRRVNEHIGPVQFNMGGIQVDADDMLKRLKEREALRTPEPQSSTVTSPDGKSQNEALASFFAGLMKRGGSAANSPRG